MLLTKVSNLHAARPGGVQVFCCAVDKTKKTNIQDFDESRDQADPHKRLASPRRSFGVY